MSFDPFDPTTWREDPDNFIVPKHEFESILQVAEADAEEQAQARAFTQDEPAGTPVPEFGGPGFKEGVQREALRQIRQGMENLDNAVQALQDAEEALADEDVAEAVRQRDPILAQLKELKVQMAEMKKKQWYWPWSKKEA